VLGVQTSAPSSSGARGGVFLQGKDAAQHAGHVAVEHRVWFLVGNGEHRGGRVGANALQVFDAVHRVGDGAVVGVHDMLGGLVEMAGAGVEPEALPVVQHLVPLGLGEGLYRRKRRVCCSMISETQMRYGSSVSRQGIDRLCAWYQSSRS
jgi:hypothetical protein